MKVSDLEVGYVFSTKTIKSTETEKEPEFVVLKDGTYLVMDILDYGYDLYDITNNKNVFFENTWIQDVELDSIYVKPENIFEFAVDSLSKQILALSAEGWSINPDNGMDLSPYIERLEIVKLTLEKLAFQND